MEAQCSEEVGHGFVKFLYTAKIQKTLLEDNYETFLRYGVWVIVLISSNIDNCYLCVNGQAVV